MVTDDVWLAAGDVEGYPCVADLERRLGRELAPADFSAFPVNDRLSTWNTPLLAARMNGTPL